MILSRRSYPSTAVTPGFGTDSFLSDVDGTLKAAYNPFVKIHKKRGRRAEESHVNNGRNGPF